MATAGEVVIHITAEDDATKIVAKIKETLNQMGKEAQKSSKEAAKSFEDVKKELSNLSSKIFNVKNLIAGLFVGFSAERFIGGIIQAGSEVEGYRAQLEALMGSAEKANQALQDLIEYARTTPFETKNVVEAAVQLQAFGVNARELIPTLGDLAAAFNRDITEAVYAMTAAFTGQTEVLRRWGIDMRMKGEEVTFIWRDSMNRMREVTVQRSNEIIARTLQMIFNEKYAGAVEKFKNTWRGLIMTLKSQWWEIQKAIAESGFLEDLKNKIRSISDSINRMFETGEIKKKAKEISDALSELVDVGWKTVKVLWELRYAILALAAAITTAKIISLLQGIGTALKTIAEFGAGVISRFAGLGGILAGLGGSFFIVKKGLDALKNSFSTSNITEQLRQMGVQFTVMSRGAAELWEKMAYGHQIVTVTADKLMLYRAELEKVAKEHGEVLKVQRVGIGVWAMWLGKAKESQTQTQKSAEAVSSLDTELRKVLMDLYQLRGIGPVGTVYSLAESSKRTAEKVKEARGELEKFSMQIKDIDTSGLAGTVTIADELKYRFRQMAASTQEWANTFMSTFQSITSLASQRIDFALFDISGQQIEDLRGQQEQIEEIIRELQEKREAALQAGDEKTAESIQTQIEHYEEMREEISDKLDELVEKHNSAWAVIWRSFRQQIIQNIIKSITGQLIPNFSKLFAGLKTGWAAVASSIKAGSVQIVSSIASVIGSLNKELWQILRVAAGYIASAAAAAVKWLVETLGPWSLAAIPAALAGIYGIWESIKGHLGFAEGGVVKLPIRAVPEVLLAGGLVLGPSWPKDTIPALLTGGEFVLKREAVQRIGIDTLKILNDRPEQVRVIKMASGGYVGSPPASVSTSGTVTVKIEAPIHITITANIKSEEDAEMIAESLASTIGERLKKEIEYGVTKKGVLK